MIIKSIKTEEDYDKALQRAYYLMQLDLKQNSNELKELDALGSLISEYEQTHYPIEPPGSIEVDKLKNLHKQKKFLPQSRVLGTKSLNPSKEIGSRQ